MAAKKQVDGNRAAQVAAARERSKGQERVTGIKPHASGSSGITAVVGLVQKRTFDDIEDQAVHMGDIVGYISQVSKTASRSMVASLTVPAAYQHELIDMADASALGFVMVRMYVVPRSAFRDDPVDEGDDDGADRFT